MLHRMQRSILIVLTLLIFACQPPPLPDTDTTSTEDGQPSLSFVFPQSAGPETVYCPDLIVAVDIDNWEVVDETENDAEDGRGHWHLRDSTGEYIAVATAEWWPVTLGPPEDFPIATFTVINAVLANHDHNELNTAVYPKAAATAEIYVGAIEGCVGGGGSSDTGMGY
jgi:hypothetical protein